MENTKSKQIKVHKDCLAVITMLLLAVCAIAGVLSLNFDHSYEVVNQYGQAVEMYGYGVYAHDTYFQTPISIGSDICILLVLVPMFVYSYFRYRKDGSAIARLRLISVYGVAFYYAASIVLGLTYNRLFPVYVALFSISLFGMFRHIAGMEVKEANLPSNGLRIFLILSGTALFAAWLPDVIPTILNSTPLSTAGIYHTCVTYVLDMGIISPLCFVCLYLLKKKNPTGVILQAILLRLCIMVGTMMLPQMICQAASGCELPLPALITKSFSFMLLGGAAFYFDGKLYRELKEKSDEKEK